MVLLLLVCLKYFNKYLVDFLMLINIYLDIQIWYWLSSCTVIRNTGNGGNFGRHFGFRDGIKWFKATCVFQIHQHVFNEFLMLKNIYLDI